MNRPFPVLLGSMILGASLALPVLSLSAGPSLPTARVSQLQVPSSIRTSAKIDASLKSAAGEIEVVVQLSGEPLAIANGEDSRRFGGKLNRAQQINYTSNLRTRQTALLNRITALGGKEVARVRVAYNAVIVKVDAAKLQSIATLPEVASLRSVGRYKIALEETVPYIGASAAQAAGVDGSGVKVAVIDSGVDYTHKYLGGAGTLAAYQAAAGSTGPGDPIAETTDGLFPTAKVVGGYDFVGDAWPNGDRTQDPDPIDFDGHGTHVADIIAGKSNDGTHVGVAPGATIVALKVCSSVTTSCNGVALLLAMDYALDPNSDGAMDDAVDVINMSLGSPYGLIQDDLSLAAANAVKAGVVVVASAGNETDRPYITGSPAATPEVISVAQTQVPSAGAIPLVITAPPAIAGTYTNTATIDWAPIDGNITDDVVYVGQGCTTPALDPYRADPAGKIALIDRGTCNISEKVRRASDAGAVGVIIGLIAPGDAVTFSNGGQCPLIPDGTCVDSIVITLAVATSIKSQLSGGAAVVAQLSNTNSVPLIGSMVTSSSRGPNTSFNQIKPDIGAPGSSVSAEVGTGTGAGAFGGTSGAAPMVSGAVALMLDAYPNRNPGQIKALLMNTADTDIYINPALQPGVLAPITRIGGGEVRVDKALLSKTAVYDAERNTGSLSFGYHTLSEDKLLCRPVRVRNFSSQWRFYQVKPTFRYANDEASRAVSFIVPQVTGAPPHGSFTFPACIKITASKLPQYILEGGALGGTGATLQTAEFDGYITLSDGVDDIHLAWQVLPHRSAGVHALSNEVVIPKKKTTGTLKLHNYSLVQDGGVDVFSLLGKSGRIPKSELPGPGDNLAVTDLAYVGARLVDIGDGVGGIQFGLVTFGQRVHPAYPGGFEVQIDTNLDGTPDWFVYNSELAAFGSDGRTGVYVQPAGGTGSPYFYVDAALNSSNIILTAPLAVMGLSAESKFRFTVLAYDNYFTNEVTDAVENMTYTPGLPKYFSAGVANDVVAKRASSTLTVETVPGGAAASPSQKGLLLMYRDALAQKEAEVVAVKQ